MNLIGFTKFKLKLNSMLVNFQFFLEPRDKDFNNFLLHFRKILSMEFTMGITLTLKGRKRVSSFAYVTRFISTPCLAEHLNVGIYKNLVLFFGLSVLFRLSGMWIQSLKVVLQSWSP